MNANRQTPHSAIATIATNTNANANSFNLSLAAKLFEEAPMTRIAADILFPNFAERRALGFPMPDRIVPAGDWLNGLLARWTWAKIMPLTPHNLGQLAYIAEWCESFTFLTIEPYGYGSVLLKATDAEGKAHALLGHYNVDSKRAVFAHFAR